MARTTAQIILAAFESLEQVQRDMDSISLAIEAAQMARADKNDTPLNDDAAKVIKSLDLADSFFLQTRDQARAAMSTLRNCFDNPHRVALFARVVDHELDK